MPILMYHQVSAIPAREFRRYTVTVKEFARQMRWLAASGYRAIDLDTFARARRGETGLPDRPVVITFDDGFQGCADHAVPVLRSRGFTAVFYVVSGHVGGTSAWMRATLGIELPLMSWETVRSLAAEGFEIGAHTVTHPRLTELDRAHCRAELVNARRRIEAEVGRPAAHLAYPFGAYNATVRELADEAGYLTACSTRPGLSDAADDRLALHRVNVYGHDSLLDFAFRVRLGTSLGERMARALGRMTGRLRPSARP